MNARINVFLTTPLGHRWGYSRFDNKLCHTLEHLTYYSYLIKHCDVKSPDHSWGIWSLWWGTYLTKADCLTMRYLTTWYVQLSPTCAQRGSRWRKEIDRCIIIVMRLVSAMQHSYLLDTHNVTFDCGIETLYYYGGEPCIELEK